jgi:hypothetical protein
MSKTKWFSGPPPSVGWWPASWHCGENIFRWWNGRYWSAAATEDNTAPRADMQARMKASMQERIKWRHRPKSWPARSKT